MYPTMPEVRVQLPQKNFARFAREIILSFSLKYPGAALDYHSLNFAPGQIEPTTAHYAHMDQIQMDLQAKQADHFVPSGGWWPLGLVWLERTFKA